MKKRGFTLVELLAVIAILAILVIMALPAVLRMFNQARIDTFSNEVNTIIRTTRQQYLLDGGVPQSFNSNSNKLPLTGNSSLEYCVSIDGNGKITELKATNGNYKYESSGTVDEVHSTEVSAAESNYELSCAGGSSSSSITYVNRQNEGSITAEDEVAIGEEHFYVVSSDNTNTVLLAKYDLKSDGNGSYMQDTSGTNTDIVKVNFLDNNNTAYWDNGNCTYNNGWSCPGTAGLKSEYANSANPAGKTGWYSSPYPEVYDSNAVNIYPVVNSYANKLASEAGISVTGKLMTNEQASSLSTNVIKDMNNHYYWLGSANYQYRVRFVSYGGGIGNGASGINGVRPVIIVSTSEF